MPLAEQVVSAQLLQLLTRRRTSRTQEPWHPLTLDSVSKISPIAVLSFLDSFRADRKAESTLLRLATDSLHINVPWLLAAPAQAIVSTLLIATKRFVCGLNRFPG